VSDHSLVSSLPARPSPRHDDGRPLRLAMSGAVVAPRNKNKSTDRHTIQRSSPATGHRRRGGCYRVYEPTTGGGFSPAAPLPTSRPQHALSDSTHVPLPPEAFDGPAHGEADLPTPSRVIAAATNVHRRRADEEWCPRSPDEHTVHARADATNTSERRGRHGISKGGAIEFQG
jgi:hypothetical protein